MLGRGVAERLRQDPRAELVAPEVLEIARAADLVILNLECCISERGEPWPDPYKPFFFRAPPAALDTLVSLGVSCVTLANNHALDYGPEALCDTFEYLEDARIAWTGAGPGLRSARQPALIEVRGIRVAIAGVTDHPAEYAAGPRSPGVAYADLQRSVPPWLEEIASSAALGGPQAPDAVVVTPHWGPNMVASPVSHVKRAASFLVEAGATLVAGHSAHVFHGVGFERGRPVLYDLGDALDDYSVDPTLRNDLGVLAVWSPGGAGAELELVGLELDYIHTRLAAGAQADWIAQRLARACEELGSTVERIEPDRFRIRPT